MLHQLLDEDIDAIHKRYVASPRAIFQLVAAAKQIDLYEDFVGSLVVDGVQKALKEYDDGKNKESDFYGLLNQIGGLSLMSHPAANGQRRAPFIITCITATCFGPVQCFLADSHRKRVYLPLNRLQRPTFKNSLPVLMHTPFIDLLVKDVGGHVRAIELIANELATYPNGVQPNIPELASAIYTKLKDRYSEAISLIGDCALSIAQCILSRREIFLGDVIPGSDLRWEHVISSGLVWFEKKNELGTRGYLAAPYVWLWILSRQLPLVNTKRLCQFLVNCKFNDYEELVHLMTGKGSLGNTTWQSFEHFCCTFRARPMAIFGD
jgi:hypothetical protein